jgi:hypothetical protein
MTLRMIDAEAPLDAAFDALEAALEAWAGGRSDAWQKDDRNGPGASGASFARRDDVYLYVEKDRHTRVLGVALSERDKDLVRIEVSRAEPMKDRKRVALAVDEAGLAFLLIAADELKRQDVRDAFRRLAGAPRVKRANVSGRDYVLIGPVNDPACADALLSLAALHPRFEGHVEKMASLATQQDGADEADIYKISPNVARQHRAPAKVTRALFERLTAIGYLMDTVALGRLTADLAMSRGEDTVVFEVRPEADVDDLQKALGHLALIAPRALGIARVIALPAPRDALGATLDPYKQAFVEMGVSLIVYDFQGGQPRFSVELADASLDADLRAAIAD